MRRKTVAAALVAIALPVSMVGVMPMVGLSTGVAGAATGDDQFVAVASSAADYNGLKADLQRAGGRVVREMPQIQAVVVRAPRASESQLRASSNAAAVFSDRIVEVAPPEDDVGGHTAAAAVERQPRWRGSADAGSRPTRCPG